MTLRSLLQDRFQFVVAALVTLIQAPAVAWLCHRVQNLVPALFALAVSVPYLLRLERPWSPIRPGVATYLALGWWSTCLVFDVLMIPATWAVRTGAPGGWTWSVAGVLAVGVGLDSVLGGPRLRRRVVHIRNLPPALDGYRIGQISDVHCGPHVSEARVARWVERLNALQLDLVAVTGDLIAHGSTHVEAVSMALGGLRARDGAFVSMGNHDYFTDGEHFVRTLESNGLRVLRNEGVVMERDGARLYVAGVDDTWTGRHDVAKALRGKPEGAPVVLLAHDPDLFEEAQRLGVDLMLSGHTHGGQLGLPGFRQLSLARVITRWTAGLYRRGHSWLYVNRGAGTTGPPIRLGAPAELAVITLRAA